MTRAKRARTPLNWLEGCIRKQLRTVASVTRRLDAAVELGLPLVMIHATEPPDIGTAARLSWEQSCDRCGAECPEESCDLVFVRGQFVVPRSDGARMTVIGHGGLCLACFVAEGGDPAELASPEGEFDPAAALAAIDMNSAAVGAGYAAVFGIPAEHAEHHVHEWQGFLDARRGDGAEATEKARTVTWSAEATASWLTDHEVDISKGIQSIMAAIKDVPGHPPRSAIAELIRSKEATE